MDQVSQLDPSGTYAVYCRSGNRSQPAVAGMSSIGINGIYELESGTTGWTSEGQPLVQVVNLVRRRAPALADLPRWSTRGARRFSELPAPVATSDTARFREGRIGDAKQVIVVEAPSW